MYNIRYGYFIGLTLALISGCVGYGLKHLQNEADHQSTEARSELEPWLVDIDDVDDDVMNGVVTLEFDSSRTTQQQENVDNFYHKIRPAIANVLNHVERSRNENQSSSVVSDDLYTPNDVRIIAVHPRIRDGVLRVPVYVQLPGGGGIVPNERLKRAVDDNGASVDSSLDTNLDDSYGGTPPDTLGQTGGRGSSKRQSIWEAHYWFFIIVLIFVCISVVLLTVCLTCSLCTCPGRQEQQHQPIKPIEQQQLVTPTHSSPGGKKPMEVQEEPLLAVTTVKPLASATAMAQAPVYSAVPPSPLDEENGWIIPMDQLTQEERLQTEVPFTKF